MKLITLVLVAAITPMTNAADKIIKKPKDLNRVSMSCAHAETKSLKERCKKVLKKDLNRVKLKLNGKAKRGLVKRG